MNEQISFNITDLNKIELSISLHDLAMKYRKMNFFQRLIFQIKARICKPKLDWQNITLADCTTIMENLPREDKSYNELIKEYFNG